MLQKMLNVVSVLTGMRKTIVMFSLIALCIVFRVKGLISGDNMVELLKNTCIAFFSANGLEHITSTVKEYVNSKGQKEQREVVEMEGAAK